MWGIVSGRWVGQTGEFIFVVAVIHRELEIRTSSKVSNLGGSVIERVSGSHAERRSGVHITLPHPQLRRPNKMCLFHVAIFSLQLVLSRSLFLSVYLCLYLWPSESNAPGPIPRLFCAPKRKNAQSARAPPKYSLCATQAALHADFHDEYYLALVYACTSPAQTHGIPQFLQSNF